MFGRRGGVVRLDPHLADRISHDGHDRVLPKPGVSVRRTRTTNRAAPPWTPLALVMTPCGACRGFVHESQPIALPQHLLNGTIGLFAVAAGYRRARARAELTASQGRRSTCEDRESSRSRKRRKPGLKRTTRGITRLERSVDVSPRERRRGTDAGDCRLPEKRACKCALYGRRSGGTTGGRAGRLCCGDSRLQAGRAGYFRCGITAG